MRKAGMAAILMLTGCASTPAIRPLRPLEIPLAQYELRGAAPEALTGTLMYEGNCLLFRNEESTALLLPVWPTGSSFNGTAVMFHEPGKVDQRIMIAQEFEMEGRTVQWPTLGPQAYLPFQHQCGAQPFVVSSVRAAN